MKSLFEYFKLEEVFTPFILRNMRERKTIMMFPDNKQVLIGDEVDEWNLEHGLTDRTPRIIYGLHHNSNGNMFYVVKYTELLTDVKIPFEFVELIDEEFFVRIKRDLCL